MKYLIILGDGMADYPVISLNGKTPLMVAEKPHIDRVAKLGRSGKLKTIPDDMPTGSAVANLGVLGYDSRKYFCGRGVLEAANMGIELADDDLALRCNIICTENGNIKNHSAGHISTEEANDLVEALNEDFKKFAAKLYPGIIGTKLYPGISYKHLLVIPGGNTKVKCAPPHDFPNVSFKELLVQAECDEAEQTASLLNKLILRSQKILQDHPVNLARKKKGKDPGNSIWPWSPGKKPTMPTFQELYDKKGAIISAVDLINGIGVYAGMDIIDVEGATGLYDTNYEGKAEAAIEALKTHDFVYLHIEATDEAGHDGNVDLKIKCIEYLDYRVTKYILENSDKIGDELTIAILPDHPTPVELRTHVRDAVPFIIYNKNLLADEVEKYDEDESDKGIYGTLEGVEFIETLFGNR